MKKLAMILALLLLLTACAPHGSAPAADALSSEAPAATTEATTATEATEATLVTPSDLEIALSFVEKSADELKAVLGEPIEAYYEESCIGDGEDGILTYDNITVYTYREADGSAETVVDAELND